MSAPHWQRSPWQRDAIVEPSHPVCDAERVLLEAGRPIGSERKQLFTGNEMPLIDVEKARGRHINLTKLDEELASIRALGLTGSGV